MMKTLTITGQPRPHLGKQAAKQLRQAANAPCVLYGGPEHIHFHTPMALLKDLIYTPKAHFVHLHIADKQYRCILQDIQFHPVNEMILHVDFLQIAESKPIKMQIPLQTTGQAPGVSQGGTLVKKCRQLSVRAYPKDMPPHITVDVAALALGQLVRVRDLRPAHYTILAPPGTPLVAVQVPRALRSAESEAEEATPPAEAAKK